jgi:hypothetical protein
VFENRVLRRIFGPKGEEVAGGWRTLHDEEDEMDGGMEHAWETYVYNILVGKPEGRDHSKT